MRRPRTIKLVAAVLVICAAVIVLLAQLSYRNYDMRFSDCVSDPNVIFTHHITDVSKLIAVVPPPSYIQGDLKAHSYLETQGERVPVYAPVDSKLIAGSFYKMENPNGEYMLDFQASCEVKYRFDHFTDPIDEIKVSLSDTPASDSRTHESSADIDFKAGDLLGYTTGSYPYGVWDFGVYNSTKPNQFADDERFYWSDIYTTGDCPFNYFTEELREVYWDLFTEFEKDDFKEFCDWK